MVMRSRVIGCGAYLPERVMTNHEIAQIVETSDEWINTRTGIRERRIAAEGELTSDLAVRAADEALSRAGLGAANVDLVVLATTTPDETFPASATRVQSMLGIERGVAFDVQAVCAGFIFALAIADNFIRLGQAETALVIGSETFSRILNWSDRSTCVLFGDGAGAVLLRAGNGNGSLTDRGILSTHIHSDGRLHDMLYVNGGPSSTQTAGYVRMEGQEVFRHAVLKLAQAVEEAIAANGVKPEDIDWLVPHQANKRIMASTARKLGLPEEKVIVTIERHANTSAASIPLALAEADADGRIKEGHLILLEALGGGLAWGSSLVRW